MSKCPRCGLDRMTRHPAMSRVDNATSICSECGTDEAISVFAGEGLLPIGEWHINKTTYHPFVFVDEDGSYGGGEILVSLFIDAEGNMIAQIARRSESSHRWSPPHEMEAR
jgi:hypothetical protein